ncbi:nuclear transport factor 2 family protein [Humibacter albus]|uniref:nuclear transport factor 2 family protein n=1 Tax=Humibacter albus TaxID=427754 RepID=UPI0003FECA5E|nr:nuclear transport factor 2 family protein [Humibacter albus]
MDTHDRLEIAEVIARQSHIIDRGELEMLDTVFTADAIYDMSAAGLAVMKGVEALRDGALRLGAENPLAHHVTNVFIARDGGDEAEVDSKGFMLTSDDRMRSVTHHDLLRRTTVGWRIARRTIVPQGAPLGGLLDAPADAEQ